MRLKSASLVNQASGPDRVTRRRDRCGDVRQWFGIEVVVERSCTSKLDFVKAPTRMSHAW